MTKKIKSDNFFSRQVQSSCERPITLARPKVACDDDNNDVDDDDNDSSYRKHLISPDIDSGNQCMTHKLCC